MAKFYGQDPRVVDQEWDELWIQRTMLVVEAERQAGLAQTRKRISEEEKKD